MRTIFKFRQANFSLLNNKICYRRTCAQVFKKNAITLFLVLIALFSVGCGLEVQVIPNPEVRPLPLNVEKKLLVFFDGTSNNYKSRTNVRRLFELVAVQENPRVMSFYVQGVGSSLNPFDKPISGKIFGNGMKERILEGYKFLSRYYNPGDKIYIFGFSRGAHQARSLAGLISYNGLLKVKRDEVGATRFDDETEDKLAEEAENIWKFCASKDDVLDKNIWQSLPKNEVFFSEEIEKLQFDTTYAEVTFLGIWDTVPGLQFKKFDTYGEKPDDVEGTLYKIQPYPNIREIAHAVSLDEKRSKFKPVLVRSPIDSSKTSLSQCWFAGVHADVGGGYEDSNDLSGISLNWMLEKLDNHGIFDGNLPRVYSDPLGLAHWSIGDSPANAGSEYENRFLPKGALIHSSVNDRKSSNSAPIRLKGVVKFMPYPVNEQ